MNKLMERTDLTLAERIWLLACTTFTAGVMVYNVITTGTIIG